MIRWRPTHKTWGEIYRDQSKANCNRVASKWLPLLAIGNSICSLSIAVAKIASRILSLVTGGGAVSIVRGSNSLTSYIRLISVSSRWGLSFPRSSLHIESRHFVITLSSAKKANVKRAITNCWKESLKVENAIFSKHPIWLCCKGETVFSSEQVALLKLFN